jgi:hypothetical protein
MSEQAKTLIREIEQKLLQLNSLVSSITEADRRANMLHKKYYFGGPANAPIGGGTLPIIPRNLEHTRPQALSSDIDYQHYRMKLRAQKVSEPEIWNRFPPQNNDEISEKAQKIEAFSRMRNASREEMLSPFQSFCLSEAKAAAKLEKRDFQIFMADKDFILRCKTIWELEI